MQNIPGQCLASCRQYLSLCLLLSSPARLPYSPHCSALTIVAYYLLCLVLVDEQRGLAELYAQLTLELGLLALAGVNLLITLASILADRFIGYSENMLQNPVVYLLLLWNLAVMALIFRRAFEVSTFLSAMIAFNYYVVYQLVLVWFYW